ncbi:MAG: squalene--hopene cyclase, partial [Chloroflexi bacterium]|nr:squalene--hopene cyclase [Chloroflexota bacterium]
FKSFTIEEGDTLRTQSCLSPVWDTCLAAIALADSGLPPDHPALAKAGEWLVKEQVLTGGDWQVKNKKGKPGGWAFEFENDLYPDTDDTAEVLIALHKLRLPDEQRRRTAIDLGLQWLLSMQSRDGGWGSFDLNNTRRAVIKIPFCDFGEIIDPPTEDVSAHCLEILGLLGYDRRFKRAARGLRYLRRTQQPDGSWWGRWGVNYIYGLGAVLPALQAIGEDMGQPYVRTAVRWLVERQNADGGWGEDILSYSDPAMAGRGPSTASQTAWALMALLAASEAASEAAQRGVAYLLRTQREDGAWDEPYFTGTGFPRDFMINYHLYRIYFPLTALGRYHTLTR